MNPKLERAKDILCRPISVIIMIALIVLSIVTYGVFSSAEQSSYAKISKLNISEIERDADNRLNVKLLDYKEAQDKNYDKAKEELDSAAYPEKQLMEIIDKYIEARYSYEGTAKDNIAKITGDIKEVTTPEFYEKTIKSLAENKVGEKSTAEIIKRFCSSIDVSDAETFTDTMYYIYAVNLNGAMHTIEYNLKSSGGEWKVNEEIDHGVVEGGVFGD